MVLRKWRRFAPPQTDCILRNRFSTRPRIQVLHRCYTGGASRPHKLTAYSVTDSRLDLESKCYTGATQGALRAHTLRLHKPVTNFTLLLHTTLHKIHTSPYTPPLHTLHSCATRINRRAILLRE
jgi:hypothetical protein